ncbi:hypothetical protein [Nocardia coubleae]|uniref:Alpha/beta hydrolase n=1 Tax=Nocardia coubleae TaxID=356147 RepID=A0A846W571_9NOCA|nr:hypothetical protein [Nocardia coubleae]NKX88341.1 hypothetical protein [Nocardia coubleae]
MSEIVLVHGIAQEQYSADLLESRWMPALAGAVRLAGYPELADEMWRQQRPGSIEARMAFYGNAFLEAGAQGGPASVELDTNELDLAERLAEAWLRAAAERAADPADRAEADRQLAILADTTAQPQGAGAALRPAINALTRLNWFAPGGYSLASRFVVRALGQVTRYFTDPQVREFAQQRVLEHIGPETRLVIAHSLGSVVTYEALHRTTQPVALITAGSPLGLHSIIYPRLRPSPPGVPPTVTSWDNLADRDDIIATTLDLAPLFRTSDRGVAPGVTLVDNGAEPHSALNYLAKGQIGKLAAAALT